MVVAPVALQCIVTISSARISIPQNLGPADARRSVLLALQVRGSTHPCLQVQATHGIHVHVHWLAPVQEILSKYPDGMPLLDPVEVGVEDCMAEHVAAVMHAAIWGLCYGRPTPVQPAVH